MRKKVPRKVEFSAVGLQHRLAMSTRRMLAAHVEEAPVTCELRREPDNLHDRNAIMVVISDKDSPYNGIHIGYVPRGIAATMAPVMDDGNLIVVEAIMSEVDAEMSEAELSVRLKTSG
jgi:hypothetical protein